MTSGEMAPVGPDPAKRACHAEGVDTSGGL